jgi:hypothetical protein
MKYIAIINTDEPLTEHTIQFIKDTIFCGDEQAPYVSEIEDIKYKALEPKTDTWSIKDVADTLSKHGLIREQKPKTGYWIKTPHGFKCSKCLIVHPRTSIFCPSCGAKMVEQYHQVTLDEYVLHKSCQAVLNDAKKEDYI